MLPSSYYNERGVTMAESAKKPVTNEDKYNISVKVDKLFSPGHYPLAIFSANIGGFAVHGIKMADSRKGLFIQMPEVSYQKDGETVYKDIFHPVTKEARTELYDKVKAVYAQARHEEQQHENSEEKAATQQKGPQM